MDRICRLKDGESPLSDFVRENMRVEVMAEEPLRFRSNDHQAR